MNDRKTIMLVPELVKEARTKAGHKQSTLAMSAGVTRATINRVERGHRIELNNANKIADCLALTVKDLDGTKTPNINFWVKTSTSQEERPYPDKLVSINQMGNIFEDTLSLISYLDEIVFINAPQYSEEIPNIVSSYRVDKITNTIYLSISHGEGDDVTKFSFEIKNIELTTDGLLWKPFTPWHSDWIERILKEFLFKRCSIVTTLNENEQANSCYFIMFEQQPSAYERNKIMALSNDILIDNANYLCEEEIQYEKYKKAYKVFTKDFEQYDSLSCENLNELHRNINLIINDFSPSSNSCVTTCFESNNRITFELEDRSNCPSNRSFRFTIYRKYMGDNGAVTETAPWPEYHMNLLANRWRKYIRTLAAQGVSRMPTNSTIQGLQDSL